MDKLSKESLAQNIENKLDDFFSEDDAPAGDQPKAPSLEKLKTTVLSIDWEITDECLADLVAETDVLLESFQDDRPTNALLRMLKALANYIRKHKAQAHQEAIKRVMSVYQSVESIIEKDSFDESRKNKIVAAEIKAFHLLKDQIRRQQAAKTAGSKHDDTLSATLSDSKPAVPPRPEGKKVKDMKKALADLESKMNDQIDQLKKQLAVIKQELSNYTDE